MPTHPEYFTDLRAELSGGFPKPSTGEQPTMRNGTNAHTARALPVPVLQFNLSGQLVPVVRDEPDPTLAALNDYDDAIAVLDAALADRDAAGALFDESDRRYRVVVERCRLARLAVQVQIAGDAGRDVGEGA